MPREFFVSWKQWDSYAHSFISMFTIVGKGRRDFKENCLRLSVVGGCHGNLC